MDTNVFRPFGLPVEILTWGTGIRRGLGFEEECVRSLKMRDLRDERKGGVGGASFGG